MKWLYLEFMVLFVLMLSPCHAELIDRGGGLIYDTEFNITWLQDANYAKTSGYDEDGRMTWEEATKFVADLKYYDPVRKVTWDDWRLPTAKNRDGSGPIQDYYTRESELGHMYYTNLGNLGLYKESKGISRQEKTKMMMNGLYKPQSGWAPKHTGPFNNLMPAEYWARDEAFHGSPKDSKYPRNAWDFFMDTGTQSFCDKWDHWYFAWPVRDGDVIPSLEKKRKKDRPETLPQ